MLADFGIRGETSRNMKFYRVVAIIRLAGGVVAKAGAGERQWEGGRWQGVVRSAGRGGWGRAVLGDGSALFGAGVRVGKGSSNSRSTQPLWSYACPQTRVRECVRV